MTGGQFQPAWIKWYNNVHGGKIACVTGRYEDIPYGSVSEREFHAEGSPPHPEHGQFQWGIACSPSTRTIILDGDYTGQWDTTAAGKLLGPWRDAATSIRELDDGTFKFHVLIEVPAELLHLWPKQLPAAFGHIKSNGFSYIEGVHASGTEYKSTRRDRVIADEALMRAFLEDNGGILHTDNSTANDDDYADASASWTDPDGAYPKYLGDAVLGGWDEGTRNDSLPWRCGLIKAAGERGIRGMGTLFSDLCAEYDIETGRGDEDIHRAFAKSYPAYEKIDQLSQATIPAGWRQAAEARMHAVQDSRPAPVAEVAQVAGIAEVSRRFGPLPGALFVKDEGGFMALRAARWVEEQGPLRYGTDDQFWAHLGGVWVPGEDELHQRIAYLLNDRYRREHEANTRELLRAAIGRISCDPVPDVINFRNGLLYWREGENGVLRPHDPEVLSTVQLAADWDPEAACPRYGKFLAEVLAPADVERAWELTGYLIMPGNPLHRLFLLYGGGRNGKGAYLRTMAALLGAENVAAVALHDLAADKFMAAELYGRAANLAGDIDATYIERTGQLKAMSGDDAIMAQRKFRHPFRFTPWAVSVFSANKIPSSSDSSHGWLARWEVLAFPNTFSQHDPELEPALQSELAGIAQGAVGFLRGLVAAGKFTETTEGREAKAVFARGQDPLSYWLEECTQAAPGGWTARTAAYASYRFWARESEMKPLAKRSFYDVMRSRFAEVPRDGYPGYSGLRVLAIVQPGGAK